MDLPDTPVLRTLEDMLDRRLMVLRTILDSEKIYLNELETLLMPMKALKATAGTSQPVLSGQQVQIVFYQVPELRDLHRDFYSGLRDRLVPLGPQTHPETDPGPGPGKEQGQMGFHLTVGDLFLKIVSQLGVYRGFIDNYESAVKIVRSCTQTDQRFRILAESMMSCNGSDKSKTKYTFEALLYKPLDRVTKTTLVLHDLLKHTPQMHSDHHVLQEALRLSRSFLKQAQYRFCWYLPLAGLKLHWGPEMERTTDTYQRIHSMRAKMYLLRHELRQTMEWREAIHRLTGDNIETVPPDLLTLTSSCVKLRMTQQPPVHSILPEGEEESLCGTLSVAVHSACGLQQPASEHLHTIYHISNTIHMHTTMSISYPDIVHTYSILYPQTPLQLLNRVSLLPPTEFSFQVDGAQNLRVLVYCPHPLDPPSLAPAQQQPIFCMPIGAVAQQEGVLVPHVVRCCVEEVERRGMEEVGIYRLSAATSDIINLKTAFNTNLREAVSRLRCVDVNAVSGILKLYFRELPEPLIPTELFQSFTKALDIPDLSARSVSMLSLLQVSDRQDVNKMPLMNLATVFGPSLLRPPVAVLGQSSPPVDISQEVVVQVQVVYSYLQCDNLPAAQTCIPHDTETTEED
ncbi:unnamed protein product, partial [Coregonus sp. 'balchen']